MFFVLIRNLPVKISYYLAIILLLWECVDGNWKPIKENGYNIPNASFHISSSYCLLVCKSGSPCEVSEEDVRDVGLVERRTLPYYWRGMKDEKMGAEDMRCMMTSKPASGIYRPSSVSRVEWRIHRTFYMVQVQILQMVSTVCTILASSFSSRTSWMYLAIDFW